MRHGETDWNARDLSQGLTEVPLNAHGIAQAHEAAALLRGRGIRSLVVSPLGRARETAAIVGAALGLVPEVEPDLHEVAFGEQEGRPLGDWYGDWIAGRYLPAGGETFAALRERAITALNRAVAREAPVLVVAHGALFRAVRDVMGLSPLVRTANATPLLCTPPERAGEPWTLVPAAELPGGAMPAPAPAGTP